MYSLRKLSGLIKYNHELSYGCVGVSPTASSMIFTPRWFLYQWRVQCFPAEVPHMAHTLFLCVADIDCMVTWLLRYYYNDHMKLTIKSIHIKH